MHHADPLALEILSAHPEEYMVQYRYATLLFQKKRYFEAIFQFQALLEKLPCNAFLFLAIGKVFEEMDWLFCAESAYRQAYSIDQNPQTERAYARILAKFGDCQQAVEVTNQIDVTDSSSLTDSLSKAEINLNCGSPYRAACIYRQILQTYPYNQEALWGLLNSSTYTRNTNDALRAYRRWPTVWFDDPIQNRLAVYYRPPEMLLPFEYFHTSDTFSRFSTGLGFNQYVIDDMRFSESYYYTRFNQDHYTPINRQSLAFGAIKSFSRIWEGRIGLIENYYDRIQHKSSHSSNPRHHSKVVFNYHVHAIAHPSCEFTVDVGYDYYDIIDTIPPFDNPIYNYVTQIGAVGLNIRTADVNVFLSYFKDRVYWFTNIVFGKYSDGNRKQYRSFRAGYRFWDLPATHVYYSYFYLDYRKPAPIYRRREFEQSAYYDPKNFEIHSIGFDTKYNVTECLVVGGETAVLFLPKVNNFAYSAFGYLDYRFARRWSCQLDLRYYYQNKSVNRHGYGGYYHAESVNLQLKHEF